jgi:hypothetical protein
MINIFATKEDTKLMYKLVVLLYTNNEQIEEKIRKRISFN